MKLAICTRSDSGINEMTAITHPIIKSFAKKWKVDEFIILDSLPIWINKTEDVLFCRHYRIMKLNHLLKRFDRVLCIDSDVVITPECPNPFEVIPTNMIGTVYEDKGTRRENRHKRISMAQKKFGQIGWEEGYINTGLFMVSKQHVDIFSSIGGEFWSDFGYDDVHLGYQIAKNGFAIHGLSYKWNHMTMMSEEWNGNQSRFDSYVIHYAGQGIFDKGVKNRLVQIKKDAEKIYR